MRTRTNTNTNTNTHSHRHKHRGRDGAQKRTRQVAGDRWQVAGGRQQGGVTGGGRHLFAEGVQHGADGVRVAEEGLGEVEGEVGHQELKVTGLVTYFKKNIYI